VAKELNRTHKMPNETWPLAALIRAIRVGGK